MNYPSGYLKSSKNSSHINLILGLACLTVWERGGKKLTAPSYSWREYSMYIIGKIDGMFLHEVCQILG